MKIPTDRKLDVVAKVSDKRKAKVRTTLYINEVSCPWRKLLLLLLREG